MFNATVIVKFATTGPLPSYIDPIMNLANNGVPKSTLYSSIDSGLIVDGVAEVSTIDTSGTQPPVPGAGPSGWEGKYFSLYAQPNNQHFYFWFTVDGSGVDPALAGATGIQIDFASSITADATIASNIESAIAGVGSFTTDLPVGGTLITITNNTSGNVTNITTGPETITPLGFTLAVVTEGSGAAVGLGDRILVKDEPVPLMQYNGIYKVTEVGSASTPWKMMRDFDVIHLRKGDTIYIEDGETLAGSLAILTSDIPMPGEPGSTGVFTVIMGSGAADFDSLAPVSSTDQCGDLIVRTDSSCNAGDGDTWSALAAGNPGEFLRVHPAAAGAGSPINKQCLEWVNLNTVIDSILPLSDPGDLLIRSTTQNEALSVTGVPIGSVLQIGTTPNTTGNVAWQQLTLESFLPGVKGDVLVFNGTTNSWDVVTPPGVNGQILTYDTTDTDRCVVWKTSTAFASGIDGGSVQFKNLGGFSSKVGFVFEDLSSSLFIPDTGRYGIADSDIPFVNSRTLLYAPGTTPASATNTNVAVGGDLNNGLTGTDILVFGRDSYQAVASGDRNIIVGNDSGVANTTGSDNIALGHDALKDNVSSSGNIAIGHFALENFLGTGGGAGPGTIAIGHDSQRGAVNCFRNTSVGYRTFLSMTSGAADNCAFGYIAGTSLTLGIENCAFGAAALQDNTTGNRACAFGFEALKSDTVADDLCAFGHLAMTSNTTGTFGNAFGSSALAANTLGDHNNAFGYTALAANTEGDNNTAMGHEVLAVNTLGNDNTGMGHQALATLIDGSNATAVGSGALNALAVAAALSHDTAIGAFAGTAMTTGLRNTVGGSLAATSTTTGNDNTAWGYNALTTNVDGSKATAIGAGALAALVVAAADTDDTAVGYNAGTAMTTGLRNTVGGSLAAASTTTGNDNTAWGYNALTTNVDGNKNTAVGVNALMSVIDPGDRNNTGIGYNAGKDIGTGVDNTIIGAEAGGSITFGNRNTLAGKDAAIGLNTGDNNVVVGEGAALVMNGSDNAIVGQGAAVALTTGIENTIMGQGAAIALTEGDGNVILGNDAAVLLEGTGNSSDRAIGNVLLGKGVAPSLVGNSAGEAIDNVIAGQGAAPALTTGRDNIILGSVAGMTVTTGSENVVLGKDIDVGAAGRSNVIALGTGATPTAGSMIALGSMTLTTTPGLVGAGTADSLPTDPDTWLLINVNGTDYYLPLYI